MASSPLDDEHAPLYTVGQVAEMLAVKQAFLRRVDELRVVSPQRSAGGQRRYTRFEISVIQQVVTMTDEGITLQAIRRIIELEQQLAETSVQLAQASQQLKEAREQLKEAREQLARLLSAPGPDRPPRAAQAPEGRPQAPNAGPA
jgi:MerR family transcriptional regulator/heat shock protein HspR